MKSHVLLGVGIKPRNGVREEYTKIREIYASDSECTSAVWKFYICSINEKFMYAFEVLLLQLKLFKGFL